MNKILFTSLLLIMSVTSTSLYADKAKRDICGAPSPILSVADVSANGIVDDADIKLITLSKQNKIYYALYDLDTNGKIDDEDIKIAKQQLGQKSKPVDQQLALLFNRNKQFQQVQDISEISSLGYVMTATSLAGHGQHWNDIVDPIVSDYLRPDGLNISKAQDRVSGMFWGVSASPVFEGGATDYPTPGGEWETQRVVSFSDTAPVFFDSPDEKWHKHAGLCLTFEDNGSGSKPVLNQFMTFANCQALPSLIKDSENNNFWVNIFMLHAWVFDLNPNGVFANTHACLDQDSPPEPTINGDRIVPPFFIEH